MNRNDRNQKTLTRTDTQPSHQWWLLFTPPSHFCTWKLLAILFDWYVPFFASLPSHSDQKIHSQNVQVELTVRNGYKTTKMQLIASLKEITDRIELLMAPLGTQVSSLDMIPSLMENNNLIKTIILHRQCERFLYDLLSTLVDQQMHIDRCLKNFRNQLNRIHEIVKFRTALPITSIFVSLSTLQGWNLFCFIIIFFVLLYERYFTAVGLPPDLWF